MLFLSQLNTVIIECMQTSGGVEGKLLSNLFLRLLRCCVWFEVNYHKLITLI